ncbi:hypothetical protein VUR80DRAFT_7648 [Thermomyces stellatus]
MRMSFDVPLCYVVEHAICSEWQGQADMAEASRESCIATAPSCLDLSERFLSPSASVGEYRRDGQGLLHVKTSIGVEVIAEIAQCIRPREDEVVACDRFHAVECLTDDRHQPCAAVSGNRRCGGRGGSGSGCSRWSWWVEGAWSPTCRMQLSGFAALWGISRYHLTFSTASYSDDDTPIYAIVAKKSKANRASAAAPLDVCKSDERHTRYPVFIWLVRHL